MSIIISWTPKYIQTDKRSTKIKIAKIINHWFSSYRKYDYCSSKCSNKINIKYKNIMHIKTFKSLIINAL